MTTAKMMATGIGHIRNRIVSKFTGSRAGANHRTESVAEKTIEVIELDGHGFAIFAPDTAQAITDLANGREGFDAIEDARQDVFISARGCFELHQRSFTGDR